MKYTAVIMIPIAVEFESAEDPNQVRNTAAEIASRQQTVKAGEEVYQPRLMGAYPTKKPVISPLVFDPPPMAA